VRDTEVPKELDERWHTCPVCYCHCDRDENAARTLLRWLLEGCFWKALPWAGTVQPCLGVHLRYSRIINRQLLIAPLEILLIVLSSTYWYTVTVSVVAPFSFFGMMVTKVQVG
jgi:hypothetical protein